MSFLCLFLAAQVGICLFPAFFICSSLSSLPSHRDLLSNTSHSLHTSHHALHMAHPVSDVQAVGPSTRQVLGRVDRVLAGAVNTQGASKRGEGVASVVSVYACLTKQTHSTALFHFYPVPPTPTSGLTTLTSALPRLPLPRLPVHNSRPLTCRRRAWACRCRIRR